MSEQQALIGTVRESIISQIEAIKNRPQNINVQNMVSRIRNETNPFIDVSMLGEVIVTEFPAGGSIRQQLVQVDIYTDKGTDTTEIDGYKAAFQAHFKKTAVLGELTVTDAPTLVFEEPTDTGYRMSLSFSLEYVTDD